MTVDRVPWCGCRVVVVEAASSVDAGMMRKMHYRGERPATCVLPLQSPGKQISRRHSGMHAYMVIGSVSKLVHGQ